jgi:pyruvate dehydrogenase E2 component (dihydrolipoamide acetyltransferase)
MATDVILPALGMSQDTGKIVLWYKSVGECVVKGEPLAEIETDKATVEIEAPVDGMLAHMAAAAGDSVPVGHVIATILAPEEAAISDAMQEHAQQHAKTGSETEQSMAEIARALPQSSPVLPSQAETASPLVIVASALAARIAAEHRLDLSRVQSKGRRIQKADVLRYLQEQKDLVPTKVVPRLLMASPRARRLAAEQGKDLALIKGTGPAGAVLAMDVLRAVALPSQEVSAPLSIQGPPGHLQGPARQTWPSDRYEQAVSEERVSNIWRLMADSTTQSWTHVPHFYLVREVNASRLVDWRERLLKRSSAKISYTDLLVKIVSMALRLHPHCNGSWSEGKLIRKQDIHIGLAMAVEDGLVVPVIHHADRLGLEELARQRRELLTKAQQKKLRPPDISDGTFTISNLGMYGVDAFHAIIKQPQAALLAVGRITSRVVPVHNQPAIQPMMILTLSCDHRAVDGLRGAQFLAALADLIEDPLDLCASFFLKGGNEGER